MSENDHAADLYNPAVFHQNSQAAIERLHPIYVGKHIAWSMDGKDILASGNDMEEVCRELVHKGIRTDRVVFDYMDDPDISNL